MSGPYGQSPRTPFRHKNDSPDASGNFRSPFVSPRNGNPGSSPMTQNFAWRNNHRHNTPRFFFQNDHHNKCYSPRGGRRGGHFRGGGSHRGSPRNNADISLYVNPSMLSDPWKDLTELLQPRLRKPTDGKGPESADTTPNDSKNSISNSASNDEVTDQITEDSLLISDTSGDISSDHTVEECATTKNSTNTLVHET